jgi:Tol biopolymer transport system component
LTSYLGREEFVALSPDGTQVAFAWDGGRESTYDIYVQLVGTAEPRRLTYHPANEICPTWSPGGTQIAFIREDLAGERYSVYFVSVLGGSETKVADGRSMGLQGLSGGTKGLSWSPTQRILAMTDRFSPEESDSVFLFSLDSREKTRLTTPPPGWQDCNPVFSPGGDEVAFNRRGPDDLLLCIQNVQGGEPRCFDSYRAVWDHAWTSDGSALVVSGGEIANRHLSKLQVAAGEVERLPFGEGATEVSTARTGGRLAYSAFDRRVNLWRAAGPEPLQLEPPERFAADSTRDDRLPRYSPDGTKVAFRSNRSGREAVWICDADGTNSRKLIEMKDIYHGAWSPCGDQIGFTASDGTDRSMVCMIDVSGGLPTRITAEALGAAFPAWSPHGRWIYFNARGAGDAYNIFKIPANGGSPEQLTNEGGMVPYVTPEGQILYWRESQIWTVSTDGRDETLVLNKPCHVLCWCTWKENVVYIYESEESGPSIEMFDLTTQETRVLHSFGKETVLGAGVTVSPNGQWILYTQGEVGLDLMLVKDFH